MELESTTAATQENLVSLKTSRDQAAVVAAQMATRVAALDERRIAAEASLQRIQNMVSEISSRIAGLQTQIAASAAEKAQRETENVELAARWKLSRKNRSYSDPQDRIAAGVLADMVAVRVR